MDEGDTHPPGQPEGPVSLENMAAIRLPQTPPDESSLVETTRIDPEDKYLDSMTEEDRVHEHLQDVESSFIAPVSPTIQVGGPDAGVDDTYLFDARANKPSTTPTKSPEPPQEQDKTTTAASEANRLPSPPPNEPPIEVDYSNMPSTLPENSHDEADTTQTTSDLETFSSPIAAVVARNASKLASAGRRTPYQEGTDQNENIDLSTADSSAALIPQDTSASNHSFQEKPSESNSKRLSMEPDNSSGQPLNVQKRPKYLRSRNASQRSSTSSFLTNDDGSDATVSLGADYALQSGGAVPAFGLSRSASNTLNRSISMGSMMSGFDDSLEFDPQNALEPLEEVESPIRDHQNPLATPKAQRASLSAPTDTVIARHVRGVEVPESLAKQYKTKGGLSTPLQSHRKVSDHPPAPGTARAGKNMTLKEQSSTIERLSKENFDLKLKVMFLDDRLRRTSEEGMQEMIAENVESRIALVVIQKENKALRRKVKELEERLGDEDGRPSTARSGLSSDGRATPTAGAGAQAEEEIITLRETVEEYIREIERLKEDRVADEFEKRKLAETIRTMSNRSVERTGEAMGKQEETDMWKDLLDQESARRQQADQEIRSLRDEVFRLKQDMTGGGAAGGAMHHTTNIYNITRKPHTTSPSRSRPVSGHSGEMDYGNSLSQSSTLVEELRRESEQLRHENTELRKDLGAQTSMLTSRNREKERLYQEIEDLKMAQRRGAQAPSTLDSLLDRSASRAGARDRPISRGSGQSRLTVTMEDPEREDLENKIAEQRDKINELKFNNQELQKILDKSNEDILSLDDARRQAEELGAALEDDLNNVTNDLMAMQAERDEALHEQEAMEGRFADLKDEFQGNLDELDAEIQAKDEEIQRLQIELRDQSDNFEALQTEMRGLTDSLIGLEDEHARTHKRIEQLEQELSESSKELEELEIQLLDSNEKAQRLGIQQESSQGEIAFLREEQEGDKVRIGDLEAALANAEQVIKNEHERAREFEERLANERKQREMVANREKEEVQQVINDLNKEASTSKEELRIMRKSLTNREVEATKWKERLTELESNLREALGDLNGTRSSFLQVRRILLAPCRYGISNRRLVYHQASARA
ncbi:hypothetical protein F5Y16DRAFT_68328 [Xylariaceae sp. FL0255]|nr:hypothetical protein F5Y16DRAFT_68328 [Xylariaceae sp. FL0255]